MKLNKKLIGTLLAVVLVVACGIFSVAALEDSEEALCCDDYRGTATRVLDWVMYGEDCEALCQTYCPECGTIFDTWWGTYCPCPHNHPSRTPEGN